MRSSSERKGTVSAADFLNNTCGGVLFQFIQSRINILKIVLNNNEFNLDNVQKPEFKFSKIYPQRIFK